MANSCVLQKKYRCLVQKNAPKQAIKKAYKNWKDSTESSTDLLGSSQPDPTCDWEYGGTACSDAFKLESGQYYQTHNKSYYGWFFSDSSGSDQGGAHLVSDLSVDVIDGAKSLVLQSLDDFTGVITIDMTNAIPKFPPQLVVGSGDDGDNTTLDMNLGNNLTPTPAVSGTGIEAKSHASINLTIGDNSEFTIDSLVLHTRASFTLTGGGTLIVEGEITCKQGSKLNIEEGICICEKLHLHSSEEAPSNNTMLTLGSLDNTIAQLYTKYAFYESEFSGETPDKKPVALSPVYQNMYYNSTMVVGRCDGSGNRLPAQVNKSSSGTDQNVEGPDRIIYARINLIEPDENTDAVFPQYYLTWADVSGNGIGADVHIPLSNAFTNMMINNSGIKEEDAYPMLFVCSKPFPDKWDGGVTYSDWIDPDIGSGECTSVLWTEITESLDWTPPEYGCPVTIEGGIKIANS